VRREIQVAV